MRESSRRGWEEYHPSPSTTTKSPGVDTELVFADNRQAARTEAEKRSLHI